MTSLRTAIIRLAHQKPHLRSHLLSLLASSNREGMEFPTQEAMQKYLKDHPGADKSKHSVKSEHPKQDYSKTTPSDFRRQIGKLPKYMGYQVADDGLVSMRFHSKADAQRALEKLKRVDPDIADPKHTVLDRHYDEEDDFGRMIPKVYREESHMIHFRIPGVTDGNKIDDLL